ncbi:phosphodiesterase [Amnibacterium flavum]|uniref:Phosphodiesterase n=1 Tax=Amnibacterium flavum TaxID=2173173 RepID=A0A2V1HYY6_9MICO|nr:phosphodiesterase [Amnibacterium flavum]PVZ96127.1 phosphodiesterase [Amnibacterium flavum]
MPLGSTPTHVIAHISDTHLLAGGLPLHGTVDTVGNLRRALERLESTGLRIDAIVHTGDIADLGELDAYERVRAAVAPVAERLGCPVVWVAGNHDVRGPLRQGLQLGGDPGSPLDTVTEVGGLRIIGLDTSVPGQPHGDLDDAQLEWVRDQLAAPAPHGTIIALHHPPVETVVHELQTLQLRATDRLRAVIEGSDVRKILAGHFHYATSGGFAGIGVSVATATSYTIKVEAPDRGLTGVDGGQAIAVLHVYDDDTVHSGLPIDDHRQVVHLPYGFFDNY